MIVRQIAYAETSARIEEKQEQIERIVTNGLSHNVANIAARWGHPASTTTTIAQQLAAIDQSIWCRNCSRHGHKEPRRERKTECAFCAVFRQDYGLDAPKTILDARDARGGRLYVQDIERILTRDHPGWEKTAPIKRAKKRKPKAA